MTDRSDRARAKTESKRASADALGAAPALFLACAPGLEPLLAAEAAELGLKDVALAAGGVSAAGDLRDVWRANLRLRGAARVLMRIGSFRAAHVSELDKKARRLPWDRFLPPRAAIRVEAACKKSRIYHSGAAAERIAKAAAAAVGAEIVDDAPLRLMARLERDICTVSIDASGEPLHKRGFKQAIGKAPLRETLAALFLSQCGYDGRAPLVDPMCGSGTILIEAAERALGLAPGRERRFAFEEMAGFDPALWAEMRAAAAPAQEAVAETAPRVAPIIGYDRDAGAIAGARANAERAGVGQHIHLAHQPISAAAPIDAAGAALQPGLVLVNPPYGERIGDKAKLAALYARFGQDMRERFQGWRVGVITSDDRLAAATALPFAETGPPIAHGALTIRLRVTGPLP